MTKLQFFVEGPFKVPTVKKKAAKVIDRDGLRDFWSKHDDISAGRGCYIFAIRASKGCKPFYVGKATKSFRQEAFAVHKVAKYNEALADRKKGTPLLFFVCAEQKRGKPNAAAIAEAEDFLIQTAKSRNWDLLNVKGTKASRWSIRGVIGHSTGTTTNSARDFKETMGL